MQKFNVINVFHTDQYLDHNSKRLKHLNSLNIDFNNKTVLELGAGIGDHTEFLLSKNIFQILVTDVRRNNILFLKEKFKDKKVEVSFLDMENPMKLDKKYDIVYCYGLLYHLSNPEKAIAFMAEHCRDFTLIETCVSFGNEEAINECQEDINNPSQANSGKGCRPTRIWIYNHLKKYFNYVYIPITQPEHEQFPIDWTNQGNHKAQLARSIFIASKIKLENPLLSGDLINYQTRSF